MVKRERSSNYIVSIARMERPHAAPFTLIQRNDTIALAIRHENMFVADGIFCK